ncbi:MAG: hypothetical protein MSD82_05570 [Prevotella sp.]|nr:hypothetical protein [Prevotella sp.]
MIDNTVFANGDRAIPMEVICKGRPLEEILEKYVSFHENAERVAEDISISEEDRFSGAMMCALYRVYLLGVEDGMENAK